MTQQIKIIVVDDHRLFRMAIKGALGSDICVSGEADSGEALFALQALSIADLVLLDINLPGMSGIEVARCLRRDFPSIKILAISAENSAQTVKLMVEAGIDGFISKQSGDMDELSQAIRAVVSGLEYFGRDIASVIYEIYVLKKKGDTTISEFTEREKEIIHLCRDGMLCKEIASRLGISTNTVNTHKKNIFLKLGINTTMEMVQYAIKKGIIG
ncbi:MAG: response regulator transcription factor [Bacteroidales bacterium]|nr:response regulator transcription factor [Bacteroidales bacterium]